MKRTVKDRARVWVVALVFGFIGQQQAVALAERWWSKPKLTDG